MTVNRSLEGWIDYIQTLHVREIDLSLERVRQVYQRLYPNGIDYKVISLAGTNGKGSTASLLASIYQAGGYQTGKYTSPHLVSFNERYQVNGADVSDAQLLEVFIRVEAAREDIRLTFFEFGTLLAIDLFSLAEVDIAIMEVGLGGRLDAVNILDADVAVLTSLAIDHSAWLGDTVEQIAMEKIGISRAETPCVSGVASPPQELVNYCQANNVELHTIGQDFAHDLYENQSLWRASSEAYQIDDLALPFGQKGVQLDNAAVAIHAVQQLSEFSLTDSQIREGIANASLNARCQIVSQSPLKILDVSHNVASVQRLATFIQNQKYGGELHVLCGMLADKEVAKSLACLIPLVDKWNLASIHHERGSSAEQLRERLEQAGELCNRPLTGEDVVLFDQVCDGYKKITNELDSQDCLVVFGSFYIVGDIMQALRKRT